MSIFVRRFTTDPGNDVLLEIESFNILDLEPPSPIAGIGTGTAIVVGEAEDGDFNTPVQVAGTTDLVQQFGNIGYTYGSVGANNPSARSRKADGALTPEFWNGNMLIQMNGKRFRRIIAVRVDTSVGSVQFYRQAFVTGAAAFSYNLEPSQVLQVDKDSGLTSATFTATAAVLTSAAGVYPTLFVGGETVTLGYDDATNFVVTFLATDQTQAQVIARINATAGFTFASNAGGGTTAYTSIRRGSGAQVRVIGASAPGVLTTLGLTAGAVVVGTGNVYDIDAVKFAELKTVVEAAISGVKVEQDGAGNPRLEKTFVASGDYIMVGPATTATAFGFTSYQEGSNDGIARMRGLAGTFPIGNTGTVTLGVDEENNFTVSLTAAQTQAQVITAINNAAGFTMATSISGTVILLSGRANGGQVRVIGSSSAPLLVDLGFSAGETVATPAVVTGSIPAGTEVQNAAATNKFVTMQTLDVLASSVGPYNAKVRHSLDDGTGASALAGAITTLVRGIDLGSFSVLNPLNITSALSELQIDAAYQLAFDSTLVLNSVAKTGNMIWAARQSNAVRRALKANAIKASSLGMFGRMAVIRTPMNTKKTTARSNVAEPGVGAYRSERVIYCYPQANSFVPILAQRGLAGGVGFTADGNVDIGADGFLCSVMSQLAPEENPGQATSFLDGVNGLELGANVKGFTQEDYKLFKQSGICALRIDDTSGAVFQSGITSVDPAINPNLVRISRRRMADYIEDSLAIAMKKYGKKLNKVINRDSVVSDIRGFVGGLLSPDKPEDQRIDGFTVNETEGNTPATIALGLFRIILKVRTLSSLDSIVLATTVGETVEVEEVLPAAA